MVLKYYQSMIVSKKILLHSILICPIILQDFFALLWYDISIYVNDLFPYWKQKISKQSVYGLKIDRLQNVNTLFTERILTVYIFFMLKNIYFVAKKFFFAVTTLLQTSLYTIIRPLVFPVFPAIILLWVNCGRFPMWDNRLKKTW